MNNPATVQQGQAKHAHAVNLLLARHFARVYGDNQATAITRAAKVIRRETKDKGMYELSGFLTKQLPARTVNGVRMGSDKLKVMCVENLERDMRGEGLL